MRNLFLFTKKLNKRTLFVFALVMMMVMVFCIGCGKDNPSDEQNNQVQGDNNQNENDQDSDNQGENNQDESGNQENDNTGDNGDVENDGGEENGDTDAGDESGDENSGDDSANSDSSDSNDGSTGDDGSSSDEGSSGNEGSDSVEDNSDMIGSGTADDPYSVIPDVLDDKMSVTTLNIPAGGTLYYAIQRIGGMVLVIEDANAFVIDAEGVRHDAVNGVVTFEVQDALASDFVNLQIGNAGGAETSFVVQFLNKEGSYANPTSISSLLNNSYEIHIEAGNSVGHYYRYYAEKDGVIRFHIESITDGIDGGISITNNRNSANRTLGADGDGTYVEIEVQAGDEILVIISVLPDRRGKYKEADITWHAEYAE